MIYKAIIPILVLGVLSLTLVTAVKNNAQVEYFENYRTTDYDLEYRNGPQIDYQKIAKSNAAKSNIDRPRFYKAEQPKMVTAVEKDKQEIEKIKKDLKKKDDKNKKTAKTIGALKDKTRKPSQVQKKSKEKKEKTTSENTDKFVVPAEELPKVNQPIINSSGILPEYQNNTNLNSVVAVSSGAQTSSPGNGGTPTTQTPPPANNFNFSQQSLLISREGQEALVYAYQDTHNALSNGLAQRVREEIEQALKDRADEYENFTILESKSFLFNLENNPVGINAYGKDTLFMSFPRSGTWDIEVQLKVHYENAVFQTTEDIRFLIRNLSLNFPFKMIHNSTGQVYIYEATTPIYNYNVSFESTSFLTNVLYTIYSTFVPDFMHDSITTAANRLQMDVRSLINTTKLPIQNINSAYYENKPNDFESIIENVDQKILDHHFYHGTVHALKLNKSADNTWAQAYGPSGDGIDGDVEGVVSLNNSAKLSGHHLASLVFRYQQDKSAQKLADLKLALAGIDKLFSIHGHTGLLARSITPLDSPLGQQLIAGNYNVGSQLVMGSINNESWLAFQGENGISRDQYSGVLFGLATAYDLVEDASVKSQCKNLITEAVEYLENHFWIFEPDFFALTTAYSEKSPQIWQGASHFKLMYLALGAHVNPEKFAAKLEQISKLADSAWLSTFFKVIDPYNDYEKFYTEITDLYTYFRIETNSERREQMKKVVRMLDFYLGHHRNVFFDTIVASIFPSKLSNKLNNMKVGLYKFVNRSHRLVRHSSIDMNSIVKVNTILPTGETVSMAKEALPTEFRDLTLENVWEKAAHHLDENDPNEDQLESVGTDLTLPFWMAKYHQFY